MTGHEAQPANMEKKSGMEQGEAPRKQGPGGGGAATQEGSGT